MDVTKEWTGAYGGMCVHGAIVEPTVDPRAHQLIFQLTNMSDMSGQHVSDSDAALKSVILTATTADLSKKPAVAGYDFNHGVNYEQLLASYATTGFQATHFSRAVHQVNQMVSCYLMFRTF